MDERQVENKKLALEGKKRCVNCQEVKLLDNYLLVQGRWPNSFCNDCKPKVDKIYRDKDPDGYRAKFRERYHNNKEHYRDLMRRSLYGVPLGTFDLLMKEQNGGCAICGSTTSTVNGRKLALDHDDESGDVRGLLCTPCNQGIGQFRHDVELMKAAIKYLEKPSRSLSDLRELLKDVEQSRQTRARPVRLREVPAKDVIDKSAEELGL